MLPGLVLLLWCELSPCHVSARAVSALQILICLVGGSIWWLSDALLISSHFSHLSFTFPVIENFMIFTNTITITFVKNSLNHFECVLELFSRDR